MWLQVYPEGQRSYLCTSVWLDAYPAGQMCYVCACVCVCAYRRTPRGRARSGGGRPSRRRCRARWTSCPRHACSPCSVRRWSGSSTRASYPPVRGADAVILVHSHTYHISSTVLVRVELSVFIILFYSYFSTCLAANSKNKIHNP